MSKNINNGFFLVTSRLGHEHEQFISAVGNLCPETDVIAVNKLGVAKPGMLASHWNINKAVFLLSVDNPDTVNSITDNIKNITIPENIHLIKIDGITKEIDPIYNSEKHLYVLNSQFDEFKNLNNVNLQQHINEFNEFKNLSDSNLQKHIRDFNEFKGNLKEWQESHLQEFDQFKTDVEEFKTEVEESYIRKDLFEGDGILIVNNGTIEKLPVPSSPSVLIFNGSSFEWKPYKVC